MVAEIMCTLTAQQISNEEDLVRGMYRAGMRSVRINTAHLTGVVQLEQLTTKLKSILPQIRILIDTKGPEIRTTAVDDEDGITLNTGDTVIIEGDDTDTTSTRHHIYVNYPMLHTEVKAGDEVLIDDGHIAMKIGSVDGREIKAHVLRGGILGSRKGLSVYGVDINLPAVSQADNMYINYAASSPLIDIIAHSFVRSADDVMAVKCAMGDKLKPIIAKIENQQGIDNLNGIIEVADGILIARGDLTASIGREAIGEAQAKIARATKDASLPLFLATNILPSMMHSTELSSADISGIRTAMEQGVDVMLLTNETASGAHPLESVSTLHRLCQ